jgi:hypothetical protein
MKKEISGEIAAVRAELENWRAQRKGKERIPEQLWRAAIGLLKDHSLYKVSHALKLNPKQLEQRSNLTKPVNRKQSQPFLEVSAKELSSSFSQIKNSEIPVTTPAQLCQLIFERADGSRLTLKLPAEISLIESICQSLLRMSAV